VLTLGSKAELLVIEALLQDDKLKDEDRHALHGAQQALRNVLDNDIWHLASQTFYRVDARPTEPGSTRINWSPDSLF
jgi:hypothetical protein